MGFATHDPRIVSDESPRVRVMVALDPDDFDKAIEAAQRAGLIIESQQRGIGTAVGTVSEDALAALSAAYGVEEVELARGYQLPGPDSPVQ